MLLRGKKEINFWKIKDIRKNFLAHFSNDIGIDLGTANILVYVKGQGVIINEPSVVAFNNKTGNIIAVGKKAKKMIGRTPEHITAERPIVDGIISNFEIAGEMISYLINKAEKEYSKKLVFFGPRIVVGVPSGITNVESRSVRDSCLDAGARKVYIIEEPTAAAIGDKRPVNEAKGTIIIDIGGGTTDIAVLSLGGTVKSKKITVAGDRFNLDIQNFIKNKYKILIGENTAEDLKISIASIDSNHNNKMEAKGRDIVSGIGRKIEIKSKDISGALKPSINILLEGLKEVLESTPPEILADSLDNGIYLSGGGSLIKGLPELISKTIEMDVKVVDDPLQAVVNGTGIILEDIDSYIHTILKDEDDGPIQI